MRASACGTTGKAPSGLTFLALPANVTERRTTSITNIWVCRDEHVRRSGRGPSAQTGSR